MSRALERATAEFVATPEQRALVKETLAAMLMDYRLAEAMAREASAVQARRPDRPLLASLAGDNRGCDSARTAEREDG